MSLSVYSQFFYGHVVTIDNQFIDFVESGDDKFAEIEIGAYTLTKYLEKVADAINLALTANVTVSVNRTTGIVTLDFDSPVDVLGASGPHNSASALPLLGILPSDYLAVTQVVGDSRSGSLWQPQYYLQDYLPISHNKRAASSTVSKSASGKVMVQKFGDEQFMKCNAKFITNITQEANFPVRSKLTAVEDAITFMGYVITKSPIEFMEDESDPDTFDRVILESTPQSSDGTGYELKENYDRGLPFYFETGSLSFRKQEDV